jgi:hypothetical protein
MESHPCSRATSALIGTIAIVSSPAWADPSSYKSIAKWSVTYHDLSVGPVNGIALCRWLTGPTEFPRCHVTLRDPKTGKLFSLRTTQHDDVELSDDLLRPVKITLHGQSPSTGPIKAPDIGNRRVFGPDGEQARIEIEQGGVNGERKLSMRAAASADRELVRLEFDTADDGSLVGRWSYLASPITQRDANGEGRVGVFRMLQDSEVPTKARVADLPRCRHGSPDVYYLRTSRGISIQLQRPIWTKERATWS